MAPRDPRLSPSAVTRRDERQRERSSWGGGVPGPPAGRGAPDCGLRVGHSTLVICTVVPEKNPILRFLVARL